MDLSSIITDLNPLDAIILKEKTEIHDGSSDAALLKVDRKSTSCSNCGGNGHNKRKCPMINSSSVPATLTDATQLPEAKQGKKRKQNNNDPLVVKQVESDSEDNNAQKEINETIYDLALTAVSIPLEQHAAHEGETTQPSSSRPAIMTKKLWEEDFSRLVGQHMPIEIRSPEEGRDEDGKKLPRVAGEGGSAASTRNYLRKHCMICRKNTYVCCEQCNTYLCIKESVNKGWNCWKLFHTCKTIVDSEFIPVRKRLR